MSANVVIHWFRRDLRLTDNLALYAAHQSGARVAPVFIFDPRLLESSNAGVPRVQFMLNALEALDNTLQTYGTHLIVRHGNPMDMLPQIARELNAQAVYTNRDYSPYAQRRDQAVQRALDMPLYAFDDHVLRAPGIVLKPDGTPYTVYTPFMKRWRELSPPLHPQTALLDPQLWVKPTASESEPLPTLHDLGFAATIPVPPASEAVAQAHLRAYVQHAIHTYATARNSLSIDPFNTNSPERTSALSPYLRFGLLSPRQVYWAATNALSEATDEGQKKSIHTWINELIWREFYIHILYHFPHVVQGNFRTEYNALTWRTAPDDLQAWQNGQTGYPIVDAALRQLTSIGWLPNRARMIVASFLTKDLLIHWQHGERYFMQWLIDGDLAANNGGWQWVAGTGTDAQPYFRIFNPIAQSRKFDPNGDYIRHWVPELRDVPTPAIHTPWQMDTPPRAYPPPIVNHAVARERTIAAFKAVKG